MTRGILFAGLLALVISLLVGCTPAEELSELADVLVDAVAEEHGGVAWVGENPNADVTITVKSDNIHTGSNAGRQGVGIEPQRPGARDINQPPPIELVDFAMPTEFFKLFELGQEGPFAQIEAVHGSMPQTSPDGFSQLAFYNLYSGLGDGEKLSCVNAEAAFNYLAQAAPEFELQTMAVWEDHIRANACN